MLSGKNNFQNPQIENSVIDSSTMGTNTINPCNNRQFPNFNQNNQNFQKNIQQQFNPNFQIQNNPNYKLQTTTQNPIHQQSTLNNQNQNLHNSDINPSNIQNPLLNQTYQINQTNFSSTCQSNNNYYQQINSAQNLYQTAHSSTNPNAHMNMTLNLSLLAQKQTQKIDINGEILEVTPLGSGSEVGRSCVVMRFRGKNIMFDCGIHPAYNGLGSLPYFDEIEPESIDLLLITHFHLDHCGALPYFLEKTNFKGDCFMTHPTKAIYKLTLADYLKVSHVNTDESLYEERDLVKSFEKIKIIDYHQEIISHGVKFWAYNAGHVLGAAMFLVEIEGIRVLYTGDFSREIDRHLKPAEIPANYEVHVLIIESTYGVHKHEERSRRENDFKR